jgi:hypothetical protein
LSRNSSGLNEVVLTALSNGFRFDVAEPFLSTELRAYSDVSADRNESQPPHEIGRLQSEPSGDIRVLHAFKGFVDPSTENQENGKTYGTLLSFDKG